jgi:hypothetical protein
MEYISSNEIVNCLWSPQAVEKCKLGLCDVILFENNAPSKWFVTGSSGEIKLKRNVDISLISKRWVTISEQLNSFYVAAIRQDGNIVKFLSADAWKQIAQEKKFEGSISSIHSIFGGGSSIIIYRSLYYSKIDLDMRTVATKTFMYTIPTGDPVLTVFQDQLKFVESKASQINKVLDLATATLVRYVEKVLKTFIDELSVDYIIDEKSQIWLLWSNKAVLSKSQRVSSPKRVSDNSWKTDSSLDNDTIAATLNNQVKELTDLSSTKKTNKLTPLKKLSSSHTFATTDESLPIDEKKFPNPFKCRGDYCDICVQNVGQLSMDSSKVSVHTERKLFTESELQKLRKDARFNSMMEFGSSGLGVAEISMRSIIHARKEQRGTKTKSDSQSWKDYPVSNDVTIKFKNVDATSTDLTSFNSEENEKEV